MLDILDRVEKLEKESMTIKKFEGCSKQEILLKKSLIEIQWELSQVKSKEFSIERENLKVNGNSIMVDFCFRETANIEKKQYLTLEDLAPLDEEEEVRRKILFTTHDFLLTRLGKFNTRTLEYSATGPVLE